MLQVVNRTVTKQWCIQLINLQRHDAFSVRQLSSCYDSFTQRRDKLTVIFTALHLSSQYLSDQLQYVADLSLRHRGWKHSSTPSFLDVRPSRLVTVGDRSFAATGPRLWKSLPVDIQSSPSHHSHHFIRHSTENTFILAIMPRH